MDQLTANVSIEKGPPSHPRYEKKIEKEVYCLSEIVFFCLHHKFLIISNGSKERLMEQMPGNIFHHCRMACKDCLGIHHFSFLWNSTYVPQADSLERGKEKGENVPPKVICMHFLSASYRPSFLYTSGQTEKMMVKKLPICYKQIQVRCICSLYSLLYTCVPLLTKHTILT